MTASNVATKRLELQRQAKIVAQQANEMEAMLAQLLWIQLGSIGVELETVFTADSFKSKVLNIYHRWIDESFNFLEQHHVILSVQHGYMLNPDNINSGSNSLKHWEEKKSLWVKNPAVAELIFFVERTIKILPRILIGTEQATSVLFPNASMTLVEAIYKDNPVAYLFNSMVADIVLEYLEQRIHEDGAPLIRILEVGAGTGGTSTIIFDKLSNHKKYIGEYCYTDISQAFLNHARKHFYNKNQYLNFKILDIQKPLAAQDFVEGDYDLVIATNVLHATKNITETLNNVKATLAHNGLIIVNELNSKSLFSHLTFGLLEGWWLHDDSSLRLSGSPALTSVGWQKVLENTGYRNVFFPASNFHDLGQQIVIAESDGIILQEKVYTKTHKNYESKNPLTDSGSEKFQHNVLHNKKYNGIASEKESISDVIVKVTVTEQMIDDYIYAGIRECVTAALEMGFRRIDDEQRFQEYGVDSIIAVKLVSLVNQHFAITLPTTVLFDYPCVNQLVAYLKEKYSKQFLLLLQKENKMEGVSNLMESTARSAKLQNESPVSVVTEQLIDDFVYDGLRDTIVKTLEINKTKIDDTQSFREYGVDSIVSVYLISNINKLFSLSLPTTLLFDYACVNQLTAYLKDRYRDHIIDLLAQQHQLNTKGLMDQDNQQFDPYFIPATQAAAQSIEKIAEIGHVNFANERHVDPEYLHDTSSICRKVVIDRPGNISDLTWHEAELPKLGPYDIRIANRAVSLNFGDLLCVQGLYPNMPDYPFTPGIECSGIVVGVGSHVTAFKPGDKVIAGMGRAMGAQATLVTCNQDQVFLKPASLSFEQACAIPSVAITVLDVFAKAQLIAGESILIQSATGGVGLIAIQLARHYGAKIIATAGSQHKLDYLKQLGVTHTINYLVEDFELEVMRITQGRGVDVIINSLSGDALQKGFNCLAAGGRYIEIAMTALKLARSVDLSVLNNNQSFHSIDLLKLGVEYPQKLVAYRDEMIRLVDQGVLSPTIHKIFPMKDINSAFNALLQRENIGKIVMAFDQIENYKNDLFPAVEQPVAKKNINCEIAIIGISGKFSQSDTVDELWQYLLNGDSLIQEVTRWDLAPYYAKSTQTKHCSHGSFLSKIDEFDPMFFNISGLEATYMDPQQRLFLQSAWAALEDAGYVGNQIRGTQCGVFVGCGTGDYFRLFESNPPAQAFWGNASSALPARIAYHLDLQGPAIAIDTACSSSLVAIHSACRSLQNHDVDIAISGGVFVQSTEAFYVASNEAGMLSPTGRCHTFDQRADGFVPGEGVGVLILKRLADAVADGDQIYGVIKGSGTNQDGASNGITAPSARSQERLECMVYENNNIHPEQIQMIEAHGTGTRLGDPIEFNALTSAFKRKTSKQKFCAIGSVKTNIGHLAAASGVAGIMKVLLSLKHKKIPPSLNFEHGNADIEFNESPFYVNTHSTDWAAGAVIDGKQLPRCAAVSSFGFSGTNAHIVIAEPPANQRLPANLPAYLIVMSAKTEQQLTLQVSNLLNYFDGGSTAELIDISFTLLMGRQHFNHRLAFIVHTTEELKMLLNKWLQTGNLVQAYQSNLDNQSHRNQHALKEYGNQCINDCSNTNSVHIYLDRLAAIADCFIHGYQLEFSKLFVKGTYKRVSLPTYPFARDSYWVQHKIESDKASRTKIQSECLHPLLHKNVSTVEGLAFQSFFNGDEFFLKDHQLKNKPVMPAVGYMEMVRSAIVNVFSGNVSGQHNLRIEKLLFMSPIQILTEQIAVKVDISINDGDQFNFSVLRSSFGDETFDVVCCQGVAAWVDDEPLANINVNELKQSAQFALISPNDCYEKFESMDLIYGSRFRGIEELRVGIDDSNKKFVLTKIKLPKEILHTLTDYVMHPSVMDSALQGAIGLRFFDENIETALPFMLDNLTIYAGCKESMWSYIRYSADAESQLNHEKIDIDIFDDSGRICMRMSGFSFRKNQTAATPDVAELAFAEPQWCLLSERYATSWDERHVFHIDGDQQDFYNNNDSLLSVINCHFMASLDENTATRYSRYAQEIFQFIQNILDAKPRHRVLLQVVCPIQKDSQVMNGLASLLKTAHLENPNFFGQFIGVKFTQDCSLAIEAALHHLDKSILRYNSGKMYSLDWNLLDGDSLIREKNVNIWRHKGVYLITGGVGGLGLIFATEIAQQSPGSTLVLVGRSPLEKVQKKLDVLRQYSVHIEYHQIDLSDFFAVDGLIKKICDSYGCLNGIIHSAGVINDSYLIQKTSEDFNAVLAPKVRGTYHLDHATGDLKLDFFVMFSSTAAVLGNVGQADYASANAFMDAFAEWRNKMVGNGQRFGKSVSLNWPLWKQGGMSIDEQTAAIMQQVSGILPMDTASGLQAFYQSLNASTSQLAIIFGIKARFFAAIIKDVFWNKDVSVEQCATDIDSDSLFIVNAQNYFKQLFSEVVQLQKGKIDLSAPFENYGIDSLMVVRLSNKFESIFGALSKTLFFEYSNLDQVVKYFIASHETTLRKLLSKDETLNQVSEKTVMPVENGSLYPKKYSSHFYSKVEIQQPVPVQAAGVQEFDIAIIGLSGRFPQASDMTEFWENIEQGKDSIIEIPPEHRSSPSQFNVISGKSRASRQYGGFIDGADEFDALFFNISPREAELMDPQERLFLQTVYATLEDAGYTRRSIGADPLNNYGANVGVFVGVMYSEYQLYGAQQQLLGQPLALSGTSASIANRVSYYCNFNGPSIAVDSMCSSALTALHLARQAILNGECESAIAGGVNLTLHANKYIALQQGKFLSSKGRCASFGEGGDGYVPSEGVGAVLLKPLSAAIKDGDHIYGVIKGSAVNHGGKTNGYTVPNPNAQEKVISRAYQTANIDPRTVSYLEAHGTGTSLGDPIEITALNKAFSSYSPDKQFCAIGSVKSNIGHSEGAAGMAGLSKVLLQMRFRKLVPSIHSDSTNPNIDFLQSPFFVQKQLEDWERPVIDGKEYPRRAGISSFGAGGSNAHLVIEEFVAAPKKASSIENQLIILSARTENNLREQVRKLAVFIEKNKKDFVLKDHGYLDDVDLVDIAYTLQTGREPMDVRLALVSDSLTDLHRKLEAYSNTGQREEGVYFGQLRRDDDVASFFNSLEETRGLTEIWYQHRNLHKLAEFWTKGFNVDWMQLYSSIHPKRVPLPSYAFSRERYWVPQVDNLLPKQDNNNSSHAQFLHKQWIKNLDALPQVTATSGTILIFSTQRTAALARILFVDSADVTTLIVIHNDDESHQQGDSPAIFGGEFDSYKNVNTNFYNEINSETLFSAIKNKIENRFFLGIIDLVALDSTYEDSVQVEVGKIALIQRFIDEYRLDGFGILQATYKLQRCFDEQTSLQGARCVGLYRMLGSEYPAINSHSLDSDRDLDDTAFWTKQLQSVFFSSHFLNHRETCFRNHEKFTPTLQTTDKDYSQDKRTYNSKDVVIITGGSKGIGAEIAKYLVAQGVKQLVILGREPLPERQLWPIILASGKSNNHQKISRLQSYIDSGAAVSYHNTSLANPDALAQMIELVEVEHGPINHVFHCAGLVSEAPAFYRKSTESIKSVCMPKIEGLHNLHHALINQPLASFVLFSSVSAVVPDLAVGQADYAMANAFMDYYAQHQSHKGRTYFRSIQWPVWSDVGMAAGSKTSALYDATGLLPVNSESGMQLLFNVLEQSASVVLPCYVDNKKFNHHILLQSSRKKKSRTPVDMFKKPDVKQHDVSISDSKLIEHVRMWLKTVFAQQFKLNDEQIDETKPFDEYGIDSVSLAQIISTLQLSIAARLDPALLFEHNSLKALTAYFIGHHAQELATFILSQEDSPVINEQEQKYVNLDYIGDDLGLDAIENKIAYEVKPNRLSAPPASVADALAIVGLAGRFPGGATAAEYWDSLLNGIVSIKNLPEGRWSQDGRKAVGGWIDDIDMFDAGLFKMDPADVAIMDPQARIILQESFQAICDAGYEPKQLAGHRIGVFIGGRSQPNPDLQSLLNVPNPILGVGQNYLASNISRHFDFKGPSLVLDTACSSGLVGLSVAADALTSKRIDAALVGAVSLLTNSYAHDIFSARNILSTDGKFRIFDENSSGEVLAEGAGIVMVKRLQDAIDAGDKIYAVIKGVATNNDGRTLGPGSPNINAQKQVIQEALVQSSTLPSQVGYIEVNGGGSHIVDSIELSVLSEAYQLTDKNLSECYLGSVKPNVGHALLSSGIAGLIRCILSVHHKKIPPFLSAENPLEHYDFGKSRIVFNRRAQEWKVKSDEKRIAVQNSFPDGGTNCHVVIEEFVPDSSYRQQRFAIPFPTVDKKRYLSAVSKMPLVHSGKYTEDSKKISQIESIVSTFSKNHKKNGLVKNIWGMNFE